MILTGGGLYHKINVEIIEGVSLSAQVTQQAIIFQPEHLETTPEAAEMWHFTPPLLASEYLVW